MAHLYVSTWRCSHDRVRISQIIKNACANASTQNMFIVIVPLGALTVTHIKDQYYVKGSLQVMVSSKKMSSVALG